MRLGLEHLLALDLHRVIHERGEGRGHGRWAVLDEQGREVVHRRTFILVGHRRFLLGGVSTSKKTSMTHLFNSGRRCVPSLGSQARLGQPPNGDLQKECCTNLPALAAIGQGIDPDGDDALRAPWGYLHDEDLGGNAGPAAGGQIEIVVPLKRGRGKDGREESRGPADEA
jgi:hypothetical protein